MVIVMVIVIVLVIVLVIIAMVIVIVLVIIAVVMVIGTVPMCSHRHEVVHNIVLRGHGTEHLLHQTLLQ